VLTVNRSSKRHSAFGGWFAEQAPVEGQKQTMAKRRHHGAAWLMWLSSASDLLAACNP